MIAFAPDGLIRLTFADFLSMHLYCHKAWLDEDLYTELTEEGIRPRAAGYCEWISEKIQPRISIGWAWFLPNSTERHALAPGGISSNLMLRTKTGYDLGPRETTELLSDWISGQPWQAGLPRPI